MLLTSGSGERWRGKRKNRLRRKGEERREKRQRKVEKRSGREHWIQEGCEVERKWRRLEVKGRKEGGEVEGGILWKGEESWKGEEWVR